jgi:hypothetical protein
MLIFALDPGKRAGIAYGDPKDGLPTIEAVALRGRADDPEAAARNFGCYLRDKFVFRLPHLIVVEKFLSPAASKSADATISQLLCHGAVHALAGCYGVPVEAVAAASVRTHFCDRASAAARRKRGTPRSLKQQRADREATNNMVLRRAIALRYLPHGCNDWDKASAASLWDWAAAHFCRWRPPELVMFDQDAPDLQQVEEAAP